MKEYHSAAMFEMLFAAMQRNTVYQRLVFEQAQLGRALDEKEIDKIWRDELDNIGDFATGVEDDVTKIYGDDAWK